jgi:pimeloyl-ACP methyl ester carboxylesterase
MASRLKRRPTLVLLCGLLCDAEVWSGVAEHLDDVADVQIADFRGLGSIDSMVQRVLGLAPKRFLLAGHSMGGRVALQAWRTAPIRIAGIALLNTGVHPVAPHEYEQRGRLVELARTQGMRALADEWLPSMLDAERTPDLALYARLVAMIMRDTPEGYARQVQALLNRPEAASLLPTLTVPTLLLSATGDRWSPPAQHHAMQANVPGGQLKIIRDAGHMAPSEQPAAVALALRTWLSGLHV